MTGPKFDRAAFLASVEDAKWQRRWSWATLAREAGLTQDVMTNTRMGRSLSLDTLVKLCVWLGETDLKRWVTSDG